MQVKSQLKPLQVAVALAGGAQGVHEFEPHEFTLVLETHCVPHLWKPVLHTKSHARPEQIATEFGGGAQGVQLVPQVAMSVSLLHAPPQR